VDPFFAVKMTESTPIGSYPGMVIEVHTYCKNSIAEQMVLVVIDIIIFAGMGIVMDDASSGSHPQVLALRGQHFNVSGIEVKGLRLQNMGKGFS